MAWAPNYATTEQLKGHLRFTGSGDNKELTRAVSAASRAIDKHCDRQFGITDDVETREFESHYDGSRGVWVAEVHDIPTTAGLIVTVDGTAVAASDYRLEPLNQDAIGRPWETIVTRSAEARSLGGGCIITVTATFGWASIPVAVEEATLLEAAKLHTRRDAPFGVAGSPDVGSEIRLLALVDPDARNLMDDYRRGKMFA